MSADITGPQSPATFIGERGFFLPAKSAREKRDEARKVLDAGGDPSAERQTAKKQAQQEVASSFSQVAQNWTAHQAARWAQRTLDRLKANLEADVLPEL